MFKDASYFSVTNSTFIDNVSDICKKHLSNILAAFMLIIGIFVSYGEASAAYNHRSRV
jgi:hypothetical protein